MNRQQLRIGLLRNQFAELCGELFERFALKLKFLPFRFIHAPIKEVKKGLKI